MTRHRKKTGSSIRKLIRGAYKALSILNTGSILLTGNPGKIGRHVARYKLHQISGRVIREHR